MSSAHNLLEPSSSQACPPTLADFAAFAAANNPTAHPGLQSPLVLRSHVISSQSFSLPSPPLESSLGALGVMPQWKQQSTHPNHYEHQDLSGPLSSLSQPIQPALPPKQPFAVGHLWPPMQPALPPMQPSLVHALVCLPPMQPSLVHALVCLPP